MPRFIWIQVNLLLVCLYSFGIAFMPYMYMARGDTTITRLTDVFVAVADSFRIAYLSWLLAFLIPVSVGLLAVICLLILLRSRPRRKAYLVIGSATACSAILTLIGSAIIKDLHMVSVALIPWAFALVATKKYMRELGPESTA
jgi:hypothetical protein